MQHIKPDSERLAEAYRQLSQALEESHWDALAKADLAIRALLSELPTDAELDVAARGIKQRLKSLHAEGLKKCSLECERLKDILSRHTEYAEGRSAYMQVDSFGGGGS